MNIFSISLLYFLYVANSLRLFLIGGSANQNSPLFHDLASAVPKRQPQPNHCVDDWIVTKCPRVAVITSADETEDEGNTNYSQDTDLQFSYEHTFLKFGMSPQHISVHSNNYNQTTAFSTPRGRKNLQIIMAADIIYFTGGDQSKHVRAWLKDDASYSQLLQVIKKRAFNDQVIIAGSSAGAMIYDSNTYGYGSPYGVIYFANSFGLAPKNILDAQVNGTNLSDMRNGTECIQYQYNAGKMPSFDWINIVFDTHFHARGRIGRITATMNNLKRDIGIGIDENTSFFYQKGQGRVFGQHGVTIFDLSEAIKIPSQYFQLKNVKVHYLTQGDKYSFNTKAVLSSKHLITDPRYKDSTDSSNIFSSYEGSLLLTRLVDQAALFNRGRSVVPEGFPENAPFFELTYSKNVQTKGYRQDEAYTVANAILDYSYISHQSVQSLQIQ